MGLHVNENEKTNHINAKIKKKEKKIGYKKQIAFHKIWPGSMQHFLRNLSLWTRKCGQTTDDCATTVALLTKSRRAKGIYIFGQFAQY